jgi:GMP synthase (glutamine-hydrolysing)
MVMDKILILDFGSQVTQLIGRRVRESNVYCEIRPYTVAKDSVQAIKDFAPKGIILSGGPSSVGGKFSPTVSPEIFELGLPILGICYGQQLMCDLLGGKVQPSDKREFGRAFIQVRAESNLTRAFWKQQASPQVWMSHGDKVTAIPSGFSVVADTPDCPYAAIADDARKFYGVQFHPEVVHTPDGAALLKTFTHEICGCVGDWNMHNFLEAEIEKVRKQVGTGKVIAGVSGGVDSTVVAALLHKAIGDQLTCIFIDHGLLRKDEAKLVAELFSDFHIPLKRKIIGATFIDVFEEEAKKVGGAQFLAQGTLYPDVIESVSVHGDAAVTIKSHHNVGGLPARMNLKLVEPVRELFKDEVRALGRELGLKPEMVNRHPFPGPGLAIRIPGAITREKIRILQEADAVYLDEIRHAGLYDNIWQAFAVLLPVQSVGVMGDGRTYDYVCALRAVTSTDGMTADFYPFSHDFLSKACNRIINSVKGINRVVYDITSKPPGTIEWE